MGIVADIQTILRMDIEDLWINYTTAMGALVELRGAPSSTPADRYTWYLLQLVATRSLDVYFQRIEEELW